jgi:Domain of unknown function (DUF4276)
LYCEGSTDNRFLPPIIERTARLILDEHEQKQVAVSALQAIEVKRKKRPESILQAAFKASGYDALIVHADADHPRTDKARTERFYPGLHLVQQTNGSLCKCLLPIIPIQAIESWMMADYELLLSEIGTKLRPIDLGIPEHADQVELIAKPKLKLKTAVRIAYASRPKRRRETDIDFLYEPVGQSINMERLKRVPSYQQFVCDLREVLESLGFISRIHIM